MAPGLIGSEALLHVLAAGLVEGEVLSPCDWLHGLGDLGVGASPLVGGYALRTNRLEGGQQNGTCQYWCVCSRMSSPKWLPPASLSQRKVSLAFCLSRSLSKISKWVRPKLLSNYYLCTGIHTLQESFL